MNSLLALRLPRHTQASLPSPYFVDEDIPTSSKVEEVVRIDENFDCDVSHIVITLLGPTLLLPHVSLRIYFQFAPQPH